MRTDLPVRSNDAFSAACYDKGHAGLAAAQAGGAVGGQAGAQAGVLRHRGTVAVQGGCAAAELWRAHACV